MRRSGLWLSAVVLTAATIVGAAACSSSTTGSAGKTTGGGGTTTTAGGTSGGTVKIGYATTLSGPYAANGVGERNGFTAYIDYVNKHGGVNGQKIVVTAVDTKATVSVAVADATQLVSSGVIGITGGLLSNACDAQAPIVTQHQVPIICSAIGTTQLVPPKTYVFTSREAQTSEALPEVNFAKSVAKSSKPKVAIIIFGSVASSGLANGLKKNIAAEGLTLVTTQNVALGSSDVSAQAAAIEAAHPTVIVGSLYDPLAVSFIRTLQAHGAGTIPFVDYDGASLSGSMLPLKDKNFYVVSPMTLTGQGSTAGLKQYRTALAGAGFKPTGPFVNVGYTEGQEMVAGLQKCGTGCTGAKLASALEKIHLTTQGVTPGPIEFTPTSHEALHSVDIYHWTTSKSAVVVATGGSKLACGTLAKGGLPANG